MQQQISHYHFFIKFKKKYIKKMILITLSSDLCRFKAFRKKPA
jgi:hypothetical protein